MTITKYSVSTIGVIRYKITCDCGHKIHSHFSDKQVAKCPSCGKRQPVTSMNDNLFRKSHFEAVTI